MRVRFVCAGADEQKAAQDSRAQQQSGPEAGHHFNSLLVRNGSPGVRLSAA